MLEVPVHGPAAAVQSDGSVALPEGLDRQNRLRDEVIRVHVLIHHREHDQGGLGHRQLTQGTRKRREENMLEKK